MQEENTPNKIDVDDQRIVVNKNLSLTSSLVPVVILMLLLAYNIFFVDSQEWFGAYTNQIILLIGAGVAAVVGFFNKTSPKLMLVEIWENWKSVFEPILILFLVGALAGTWLLSGIIPAMVYYGLQVLSPAIFLPASCVIAAIVSITTGSSWTTSATVGIALVGIGTALGIPAGMIAGAVISGAYFGDKLSPLSDTTNLAPAMAGTGLFTHIKYMSYTTTPTILVSLIVFAILSGAVDVEGTANNEFILSTIEKYFNITPWLFVIPLIVIVLILFKTKPIIALASGVVMAIVFSIIFQSSLLDSISKSKFDVIKTGVLTDTNIEIDKQPYLEKLSDEDIALINSDENLGNLFTDDDLKGLFNIESLSNLFSEKYKNKELALEKAETVDKLIIIKRLEKLFSAGGMNGMLWTIYLILCAMVFGGVLDAIGALQKITKSLLSVAKSIFGLFASTVASCLGLNIIASDQYLSIVIPGKMFKQAYEDRGLAPENLSRTLEDAGTVTSVLIPWNTCGAYQSSVLGVGVGEYFIYAVFNYLSPFTTLFYAALNLKIRSLRYKK